MRSHFRGGSQCYQSTCLRPSAVDCARARACNASSSIGMTVALDGGPWASLDIEAPGDIRLLDIISRGRLRMQGMTQLDFESAEPSFDELSPAAFFRRFPEGRYEISARTQAGLEF